MHIVHDKESEMCRTFKKKVEWINFSHLVQLKYNFEVHK